MVILTHICGKSADRSPRAASGCARPPGLIGAIPGCPVVSVSWATRLPSVGRCQDGPATVV